MKPLDYTLYNKVKSKFQPIPGAIIFVSLADDKLADLEGVVFKIEEVGDFRALAGQHSDKLIPYAVIGGFEEGDIGFYFVCREFEQEEDLLTGKILVSSLSTYHNNPVNLEAVKKDLQKLCVGIDLSGNA